MESIHRQPGRHDLQTASRNLVERPAHLTAPSSHLSQADEQSVPESAALSDFCRQVQPDCRGPLIFKKGASLMTEPLVGVNHREPVTLQPKVVVASDRKRD